MSKEINCTYEKFLSVSRFKSPGEENQLYGYSTTMHYYNRDLDPICDGVNIDPEAVNQIKMLTSPYDANTKEYKGNIVSKQFKDNMVSSLGVDTICTIQGQRQTKTEVAPQSRSKTGDSSDPPAPSQPSKIVTFSTLVKRILNNRQRRNRSKLKDLSQTSDRMDRSISDQRQQLRQTQTSSVCRNMS